jgi:peroxiredoxin
MTTTPNAPLQPGDDAPTFALPAVNRQGVIGLEDFRGKAAVLVVLMRGLHCPFCRRHVVQLGITRDKLEREGVETLAVVNTPAERARQYFQYRPTRVTLASDADVQTHRAFGLPKIGLVPDDTDPGTLQWPHRTAMSQFLNLPVTHDELPETKKLVEATHLLHEKDGYEFTEADQQMYAAHGTQMEGQFLIDSRGTIRWSYIEGSKGIQDFMNFPACDDKILAAVEALPR